MIRVTKFKRKNPNYYEKQNYVSEILGNIPFKEFDDIGSHSEIYIFELYRGTNIQGKFLKSGKYILKIWMHRRLGEFRNLSKNTIDYFKTLSNYGLIPKIYIIKSNFMIMDYKNGKMLRDLKLSNEEVKLILDKVEKIVKKWHELGFEHGDLTIRNIIITEGGKIYLIDPSLETVSYTKFIGETPDKYKYSNYKFGSEDLEMLRYMYLRWIGYR